MFRHTFASLAFTTLCLAAGQAGAEPAGLLPGLTAMIAHQNAQPGFPGGKAVGRTGQRNKRRLCCRAERGTPKMQRYSTLP